MKAIAVGPMRPKAAGSGERNSVGVRSGSVRLQISSDFGNMPAGRRWRRLVNSQRGTPGVGIGRGEGERPRMHEQKISKV